MINMVLTRNPFLLFTFECALFWCSVRISVRLRFHVMCTQANVFVLVWVFFYVVLAVTGLGCPGPHAIYTRVPSSFLKNLCSSRQLAFVPTAHVVPPLLGSFRRKYQQFDCAA
jgi:hypothetical protein